MIPRKLSVSKEGSLLTRRIVALLALAGTAVDSGALQAVVISEIQYNPPAGDEGLELVELANDSSTPEDISGYAFTNGIDFVVPPGTILGSRGFLVIAADAEAVKARHGIQNVIGNYSGRLDASGERLTLVNHAGVVLQSIRFRDRGKWPAEPDGTGHTLSLKNVHLDSSEPESWAPSLELGGTPGLANFPADGPRFEERVTIARGATWRYAKGTQAFSTPETAWRQPAFDDSGWLEGPSGFGYGDTDDATVLDDMQNNYLTAAIRKRFQLTQADLDASGEFYLAIDYDDGFCAFLNGVELARANCGIPGEDIAWNATATAAREAGVEEAFLVPRSLLVAGENVLAIGAHNFSIGSSDLSLIPRFLHRRVITSESPGVLPVKLNELFRGASAGQGWVEIYNTSSTPVDLAGYRLTDDPDRPDPFTLPGGSAVPARGFLVIQENATPLVFSAAEVHLFLLSPSGTTAHASVFDRAAPPGAAPGGYSEARFPDGGPLEWVTAAPTSDAPNSVARTTDIVINEIFYHPPERVDAAIPPEERLKGEFVELHNRGSDAIDVSGFRFDKGIDFTIPDGTIIQPGAYLVVAEDPALITKRYAYPSALGPYTGNLANDGENLRLIDRAGNLAGEVSYEEGGAWSRWADGDGSSLELVDPDQDNSFGAAWDASDETAKASWERLAFTVPRYTAAAESELHLYLVERGTCLVDDVAIQLNGTGANIVPNPGFETAPTQWLIEGTHVSSRRITTDRHSGAACLEVNASSKGDTLVNRIEVETSPAMTNGARYDVSLWARWQRGASTLVAHGEFTAGAFGGRPSPATNLSGNSLSSALRMTVPLNLGTPGAENSARKKLRAATGGENQGPVIAGVRQSSVSPSPGEAVTITARVSDSDGVASVEAEYREGNAQGTFTAAPLLDDGAHGDGDAGDGVYGGQIPGTTGGARFVFYLDAADALGARRRHPADAPATTCLYQVQGPLSPGIDAGRIVLDTAREAELASRTIHSNELLDGSFVFNDEEVYYNVGVRYRGSPWGRPGRKNFRVRFEEDKPFHRGRKAMNIDPSNDAPQNEGPAYFIISRNSGPGSIAPACDYGYVRAFFNGARVGIGIHGFLQPVDRDFVNTWYGEADGGIVFKVEGRKAFNDGGALSYWDGASFIYRNEEKENYRDYFIQGIRRSADDWQPWLDLARVMDRNKTASTAFDQQIGTVLDVEEFLRVLTPRILEADWDAFGIGNGHNGYMVFDRTRDLWTYLGYDMDFSFQNPTPPLFPTADPDIVRLMSRPGPKRTYYRILWEYINGYWSSAGAGPYLDALQAATGLGTGGVKGYLDQTGAYVRTQVQSSTTTTFRIVTNSGNDITTDQETVQLQGDAPVTVASIAYQRNGDEAALLEPAWTTPTRWQAVFALSEAVNAFDFLGFDANGSIVKSTKIKVTTTAFPGGPALTGVFPEKGPAAGGTFVTLAGSGFTAGMTVSFRGVEAAGVNVLQADVAQAIAPPAAFPLPVDGKVDVEVVIPPASRVKLTRGFAYTLEGGFVRGDVTNDRQVDISDSIASLFYLFGGVSILCPDAADVDDSGIVNLTDIVASLNYLFKGGAPPANPFPAPGPDPTADGFTCPE